MNNRKHRFCSNSYISYRAWFSNVKFDGLVRTYAEGEDLIALIGSSDHLEIALKDGSASAFLGAKISDEVKIK
jgi:S-adenosylmethionine hydrolase